VTRSFPSLLLAPVLAVACAHARTDQEETRDLTWNALPRYQVAPKTDPSVPDDRGCVAHGLLLDSSVGDENAAAQGNGDTEHIAACEKLLGLPPGAGIPVP
jgi:hypothetical protein